MSNPSIDDLFVKIAAKGIMDKVFKIFKGKKLPPPPPMSRLERFGEAATVPAVILGGGTIAGAYVSSQGSNQPYEG